MLSSAKAITLLWANELPGHYLIVCYSTIDTLGLLYSPPEQVSADRKSFKAWVDRFLIPRARDAYNAADLYAARCAVLHSHSTSSDLSRSGKARQVQYYFADRSDPKTKELIDLTGRIQNGGHIAVHIHDFGTSLVEAMSDYVGELISSCNSCGRSAARLREIIQTYPVPAAP
jgi:hypothetical protein